MAITKLKDHKPIAPDDYILGNPLGPDGPPAMPREAIHLVGGASGAGKTTLVFQMLAAMQRGEAFLGYPTKDVATAYITLDRTLEQTRKTLQRCGVDATKIPIARYQLDLPDPTQRYDQRTHEILVQICSDFPDAKLLIIDGFSMLCSHGKINDYLQSAVWLQRTTDFLAAHNKCLIGLCHSPKQRSDSKLTDPRQYIIGSSAQGGSVASIIVVETCDALTGSSARKVYMCPRDLGQQVFDMVMDEKGRMVISAEAEEEKSGLLEAYMAHRGWEADVTSKEILTHMEKVGASAATTYRYLKSLVASGKLLNPTRGIYRLASQSAGVGA